MWVGKQNLRGENKKSKCSSRYTNFLKKLYSHKQEINRTTQSDALSN